MHLVRSVGFILYLPHGILRWSMPDKGQVSKIVTYIIKQTPFAIFTEHQACIKPRYSRLLARIT